MKLSQYLSSITMWLLACSVVVAQQNSYKTTVKYAAPPSARRLNQPTQQSNHQQYRSRYQNNNSTTRSYNPTRYQPAQQPAATTARRVNYQNQRDPQPNRYQHPQYVAHNQDKKTPTNKTPPSISSTKSIFKAYAVTANQLQQLATRLQKQYANDPKIKIVADRRTSQLLVSAPSHIHATIKPILAQFSKKTSPASQRIVKRQLQLKNVKASGFEQTLKGLSANLVNVTFENKGQIAHYSLHAAGRPGVSVSVDRTSNQVTLEGTATLVNAWSRVISSLDVAKHKKADTARVVALAAAKKQDIRKAITVFRMGAGASEKTVDSPKFKGDFVTMLFQKPEDNKPEDNKNQKPDNKATEPKENETKKPNPLVGTGLIGPVQIEYLEEFNLIIIKGHPRDVERVAKIIQEIEALSETTKPVIMIHPLTKVGSEAMATMVTQLYNEILSPRQGSVSITPLTKPNAILLIGRTEAVKTVVDLIKKLDTPVGPENEMEVFSLAHVSAQSAQQTLREFFGDNVTFQVNLRQNLGTKVLVVSDYRTNSLIVQASPRDMKAVRHLLGKIDVSKSKATNDIRVFVLKNSLAEDLAPVIQQAILGPANIPQTQGVGGAGVGAGVGQGSQQQQQLQTRSLMLRLLAVDKNGRKFVQSGLLSDVRVTADARTNALIVTAPADSMQLITALIDELDRQPSAEAQIKVFTVANGDAQGLAETLETLFGETQAQGQGQNQLPTTIGATSGDTSALVPLRLAVDQRTNSVIVSGSAGDLEVVESILLRLDDSNSRARETTVYRLKNSPAQDVSDAINQLLTSRRQLNQSIPGVTSNFEQFEQEVIVVPEVVSNTLIVSATPRYAKEIEDLVKKLDEPLPMVMIQVLIAEVRLNAEDEFGIELGFQDSVLFDRSNVNADGTSTPGFLFNSQQLGNTNINNTNPGQAALVGAQGLGNFGLGRSNDALGFGGLVLQASSESVNLLIRALQQDRRVDILSRPQVMTLDNQLAQVQVGARVPRITSSNVAANGSTINNTVLEDVGIILRVTPRISPDNQVVMEIDAIKSKLGEEEDGIPISINANGDVIRSPQIDTINVQTTVSAASGQTIVLGGLITKRNSSIERQVPFLGDIPILGRLFRYDQYMDERTELLFIMTPHIVRNEEDAARIKAIESSRMSWCMADVIAIHGGDEPGGLGLSENGTRVIYPDSHTTTPEFIETPSTIDLDKPPVEKPKLELKAPRSIDATKNRMSQLRRRMPPGQMPPVSTGNIRQAGYIADQTAKAISNKNKPYRLPPVSQNK